MNKKKPSEIRLDEAKERLRQSISRLGTLIESQNTALTEEQKLRKNAMKDLDSYIEKIEEILANEEQ